MPAIGQLYATHIRNGTLGRHLDRKHIRLRGTDKLRNLEHVTHVHADHLATVCNQLPIQPNLGSIIDARQFQPVGFLALGHLEARSIPPVLFVEVLRHFSQQVHSKVEVGVDPVFLKDFENGRRHSMDWKPAIVTETRFGDLCSGLGCIFLRDELPSAGEFGTAINLSGRRCPAHAKDHHENQ